ncbi:unnamed protein product [Anisakis simplex]|uniref:Uncharacterized protein n=1 Tax=Anisakis simplex TaxID=6269 RepID=A0A0M3JYX0_ANISI|nr:unnamed protein product [Anisakis simplex]
MFDEREYRRISTENVVSGSSTTKGCKSSSEVVLISYRPLPSDDNGFVPSHHHHPSHGDSHITDASYPLPQDIQTARYSPSHFGEACPEPIGFRHFHQTVYPSAIGIIDEDDAAKVMPPGELGGGADQYGGSAHCGGGSEYKPETTSERPEFDSDGIRILYYRPT